MREAKRRWKEGGKGKPVLAEKDDEERIFLSKRDLEKFLGNGKKTELAAFY